MSCQVKYRRISQYFDAKIVWISSSNNLRLFDLNESVCELPIGQSCDWHTSPKRELDDVLATAG